MNISSFFKRTSLWTARRLLGVTTNDRFIRQAMQELILELRLARQIRHSNAMFAELGERQQLQVELGGGAQRTRPGWINIDLSPQADIRDIRSEDGDLLYIKWDLRLGLPLESESCSLIYASHFLEHIDYHEGVNLLRDCYRCLHVEGRLRLAMPDFERAFDAYLRRDHDYFSLVMHSRNRPKREPGTECLVDFVNMGVYERGLHKCIHDKESLTVLLQAIGFSNVTESSYLEGLDPDTLSRRRYSFHLEAVK